MSDVGNTNNIYIYMYMNIWAYEYILIHNIYVGTKKFSEYDMSSDINHVREN